MKIETLTIDKVIYPAVVRIGNTPARIFCHIRYSDGKLSISGVIGPKRNGDAVGSCGQIDMEFAHRNPSHDDKRYLNKIQPDELTFSDGWNADMWLNFLEFWKIYHLNDMKAECEHQRSLGWTYEEHHDPKTFKGENCPTCGYSIGSKWLRMDVPFEVLEFLESLPVSHETPALV